MARETPPTPNGSGKPSGVPFDALAYPYSNGLVPPTDDPAFQRPVDATDALTKQRAGLVYRDLPLVTIQNTWSVDDARSAIYSHMLGQFYSSGMLCDSIIGDDRVTATLNARCSALFGREICFEPADDSSAARDVCDRWERWWPRLFGTTAMRELQDYGTMMGFAHAQILWDTTQPKVDFGPYLMPWHPVFEWYSWPDRKYVAIGQDAAIPIVPGNAKWFALEPFGSYRGWIRGALRAVVEPWLLRHFGFRDMARFGEVHGNPTRVGEVPIVGDPTLRAEFKQAIANLGADPSMTLPKGIDEGMGYDYRLVEAQGKAWEVHPAQIDRCDMAIVLAICMVNLPTQVDGGSYAAVKGQLDVKSEGTQIDNKTWSGSIYNCLARPFAYLNGGDAALAPRTWWNVTSRDEYTAQVEQFQKFGMAVEVLRRGGIEFKDVDALRKWSKRRFGLDLPDFKITEPVKQTPAKAGEAGTPAKPQGGFDR
jgi:hypothetical protein